MAERERERRQRVVDRIERGKAAAAAAVVLVVDVGGRRAFCTLRYTYW